MSGGGCHKQEEAQTVSGLRPLRPKPKIGKRPQSRSNRTAMYLGLVLLYFSGRTIGQAHLGTPVAVT